MCGNSGHPDVCDGSLRTCRPLVPDPPAPRSSVCPACSKLIDKLWKLDTRRDFLKPGLSYWDFCDIMFSLCDHRESGRS